MPPLYIKETGTVCHFNLHKGVQLRRFCSLRAESLLGSRARSAEPRKRAAKPRDHKREPAKDFVNCCQMYYLQHRSNLLPKVSFFASCLTAKNRRSMRTVHAPCLGDHGCNRVKTFAIRLAMGTRAVLSCKKNTLYRKLCNKRPGRLKTWFAFFFQIILFYF